MHFEILPVKSLSNNASIGGDVVEVIVIGPILGSMDSKDIKTDLTCNLGEILLTAVLTRSAEYSGAAGKNLLWRPVIELRLQHPPVKLRVKWLMYLTNGLEVQKDKNVPSQTFPLELVETINSQQ
jgi:hypothetical protein